MSASIAFILFAAAITPGPNNLVVLDVARRGLSATLAPIAGIVLGTLLLILALRLGLDVALSAYPAAEPVTRVAGACILGYLALRALIAGWSKPLNDHETPPEYRALFFAMFSFQLINPKTWILASAVSATHAAHREASLVPLIALTLLVPGGCLIIWSTLGCILGQLFHNKLTQKALSAAFAFAFAAFAVILLMSD